MSIEKPRCLLTFSYNEGKWIAPAGFMKDGKDGCARKICGFTTCHNYGKGFAEPDRLILTDAMSIEKEIKEAKLTNKEIAQAFGGYDFRTSDMKNICEAQLRHAHDVKGWLPPEQVALAEKKAREDMGEKILTWLDKCGYKAVAVGLRKALKEGRGLD